MGTLREPDLIVNADGSVYHLCMRPEELADIVVLAGDPKRVGDVARFFEQTERSGSNREFVFTTGRFHGTRITALSTGIGTDNIDIVLHELEALANYDLKTRTPLPCRRRLKLIRIGTSGAIQPDVPLNSSVLSTRAVGLDNLIYYYHDWERVTDAEPAEEFIRQTGWSIPYVRPYMVGSSPGLAELFQAGVVKGMTLTAPGFYGPQGRSLTAAIADPGLIAKLSGFSFRGERILNFEMESSALYGLAALMGHDAVTLCAIIANRALGTFNANHQQVINDLIGKVLETVTC